MIPKKYMYDFMIKLIKFKQLEMFDWTKEKYLKLL